MWEETRLTTALRQVLSDVEIRGCRFPPEVLRAAAVAPSALDRLGQRAAAEEDVVSAARSLIEAGRAYGLVTGIYWPELEHQIERISS